MKIHDIFHISLLRKIATNFFTEQIQSSSSSIMINEKEKYEIDDVLNNRYYYEKLQYKIVWIDHSLNKVWYSTKNFQNHSKKVLNDYHQRYLNKSKSTLRLITLITLMTKHFYWLQQAKNLIKDILNKIRTKIKKNKKYQTFINTFNRH